MTKTRRISCSSSQLRSVCMSGWEGSCLLPVFAGSRCSSLASNGTCIAPRPFSGDVDEQLARSSAAKIAGESCLSSEPAACRPASTRVCVVRCWDASASVRLGPSSPQLSSAQLQGWRLMQGPKVSWTALSTAPALRPRVSIMPQSQGPRGGALRHRRRLRGQRPNVDSQSTASLTSNAGRTRVPSRRAAAGVWMQVHQLQVCSAASHLRSGVVSELFACQAPAQHLQSWLD